ncbi:MAG: hypothetical protein ABI743_13650, partial [bacterium]
MSTQLMVEAPTDLLMANLRVLAGRNMSLAQRVGVQPRGDTARGWEYAVETARSGDPTLVAYCDSQRHYVHSRYDPRREAAEL